MQLGIIGAILFAILLLVTFVKLWRLAVRHTSALYLWPILIFMGLGVWSLTESRMLIEIGWVLLMLFAIKVNESPELLEPKGRSAKRTRIAFWAKKPVLKLKQKD
jgi:O-antigen ligase